MKTRTKERAVDRSITIYEIILNALTFLNSLNFGWVPDSCSEGQGFKTKRERQTLSVMIDN